MLHTKQTFTGFLNIHLCSISGQPHAVDGAVLAKLIIENVVLGNKSSALPLRVCHTIQRILHEDRTVPTVPTCTDDNVVRFYALIGFYWQQTFPVCC